MTLTNNKENVRYLFYTTVGGIPKSVKFEPLETIEIADLESEDQIIYNSLDYKLKSYNERFGTDFDTDFTLSDLDIWYDSLSVKPSAGLWTDIQTLVNGMISDGDYAEMDLLSVHAAMETDEQRLKPFKTTAGEDFVKVGTPTLNSEGFVNPTPGSINYINTKWNPFDNGVKYTLNNAYVGVYGDTTSGTSGNFTIMGSTDESDASGVDFRVLVSSFSATSIIVSSNRINSDSAGSGNAIKSGLTTGAKRYYAAIKRTSSTQTQRYCNGVTANQTANSTILINYDLAILALLSGGVPLIVDTIHKTRACVIGSSSVDSDRVAARLNTFFAARGLTISNY